MSEQTPYVLLDPKHKLFADKYLETGRIQHSARAAGYAPGGAHVSGNRLLKRADVQAYLEQRAKQLSKEQEPIQQRVIQELEKMAFANIADFIRIDEEGKPQVDFSTATPEQLSAITAIKSKRRKQYNGKGEHIATEDSADFVLADKYRGLELLGKHHGLFKEAEQRIVHDVADRLLAARRRLTDNSESEVTGGGGAG